MAVTAAKIKELRELTGVGMSECKITLVETDGDIQKAIELLREKGLAAASKKAGRIAAEGLVKASVIDGKFGVIVEVNSETDFVAKNEAFIKYVDEVIEQVYVSKSPTLEFLLEQKSISDESLTVKEVLSSKIAVIGENLSIRRFEQMEATDNDVLVSYVHGAGKVAVLLKLSSAVDNEAVHEAGKNLCMQIASMSPRFVDKSEISEDFIASEREILKQQAINEGKPEILVEKMVDGRLKKQLKEFCLVEQEYVKGDKQSVEDYLKEVSSAVGCPVSVVSFVRYETGEGIEKAEENFADEVSKAIQG